MNRNQIFHLIHYFQKARIKLVYLQPFLYLVNLLIHIIIYMSLADIGYINLNSILSSMPALIICITVEMGCLLQLVCFMLWRKQFHLVQQLAIFRFVIAPILLIIVMNAVQTSTIPSVLGFIIFAGTQTISTLLSRSFLYQLHRVYSIRIQQTPIIYQIANFQILLVSFNFITTQSEQHFFSLLLFIVAFNTTARHFLHPEDDGAQYKILAFVNLSHVFLSALLFLTLIINSIDPKVSLIVLIPIFIYFAVHIFLKKMHCHPNIASIFQNQASYEQFLQTIQYFLVLLKKNQPSNKRDIKNMVYSLISQHKKDCCMPNCQLQTKSTVQQLKNLTSKSAKLIVLKILKKIEWLFEQYHLRNADNLNITFTLLKFYAYYLPHRVKMQDLLLDVDVATLNFEYQCELYQYTEICKHISDAENIDAVNQDQQFLEFQSALLSTLNCMIQFWSQFYEDKVDLNRIMQVSAKLFPFKQKIQQISEKQLKNQRFSAFKILHMYCQYLRSILNKYELAAKIQDYLSVLSQRLKDRQQIKYLSKQSEAGFIVISLSESKLGNIFLVNQKACVIFKYAKKEFLTLRVNAIMPSIFADIHDNILTNFLKTKRKKFNTDLRSLFGKDGNGYLFPVQLQLQKASFSANDQFIFIACVLPQKLKNAPLYCVVDHQGDIKDYTASFKNIFFRSSHKKVSKNIQQVIPNYFDDGYSQLDRNSRQISIVIKNKKLGQIQLLFEIFPVIVKDSHEGFLIKATYQNPSDKNTSDHPPTNMTSYIKRLIRREQIGTLELTFDWTKNIYLFQTGIPHQMIIRDNEQEFTLPFLRYQDMAVFANQEQLKHYGGDIKIIRLINNHFERIQEESSFHSEVYDDEQKTDIRLKIDQMRQKFANKQEKAVLNVFKVAINILFLLITGTLIYLYFIYMNEIVQQKSLLNEYDFQKQVKYYLPEYIIYFSLANAGVNSSFFEGKMTLLQHQLVSSVINANIAQIQKEEILKIIYIRSTNSLLQLLNSDTVNFVQSDSEIKATLYGGWSVVIILSSCLLILQAMIIYNFKAILFRVYLIFLGVRESSIRHIHNSCKSLISKIHFQSLEKVERDEQQRKAKQDNDTQNQIQKIKQFKNTSRVQDNVYLIKMAGLLIPLIGFCFLILFLSTSSFQNYQRLKSYHQSMFEVIPTSSIQFMKIVLKLIQGLNLNVNNQYIQHYQKLQIIIEQFSANSQEGEFMQLLLGDVCLHSKIITSDMLLSCNTINNGILNNGISSAVNFIAQNLGNMGQSGQFNLTDLITLIDLQFLFVNPVLVSIEDDIQDIMRSTITNFNNVYGIISLLGIAIYLLYDLYLILYPLRSIEIQINFTNGMISLMPDNANSPPQQLQTPSND